MLCSSGVIWEEKKRKRYKAMKLKHSTIIEEAYQKFVNAISVGQQPAMPVKLADKMEVGSVMPVTQTL